MRRPLLCCTRVAAHVRDLCQACIETHKSAHHCLGTLRMHSCASTPCVSLCACQHTAVCCRPPCSLSSCGPDLLLQHVCNSKLNCVRSFSECVQRRGGRGCGLSYRHGARVSFRRKRAAPSWMVCCWGLGHWPKNTWHRLLAAVMHVIGTSCRLIHPCSFTNTECCRATAGMYSCRHPLCLGCVLGLVQQLCLSGALACAPVRSGGLPSVRRCHAQVMLCMTQSSLRVLVVLCVACSPGVCSTCTACQHRGSSLCAGLGRCGCVFSVWQAAMSIYGNGYIYPQYVHVVWMHFAYTCLVHVSAPRHAQKLTKEYCQ